VQLGLQHARVDALEDADHALEHQLVFQVRLAAAYPQLAGHGQEAQIGGGHAIDGGHKGHGDAAPHLLDVVEVLHYLNKAENGADDADGGGEAAGGIKGLDGALGLLGLVAEFEFHIVAQLLRLGAIHRQHQSLAQKGFLDALQVLVEGYDALLAGLLGKADDLVDQAMQVRLLAEEDGLQLRKAAHDHVQRELKHDRAQGAADDDQGRGGLENLTDVTAVNDQAGENSAEGDQQAEGAATIHVPPSAGAG